MPCLCHHTSPSPLGPHPLPAATIQGTPRVTADSTSYLQGPPRAA